MTIKPVHVPLQYPRTELIRGAAFVVAARRRRRAAMPTLFTWDFGEGDEKVVQRVYPGDDILDSEGEPGNFIRLDGSKVVFTFLDADSGVWLEGKEPGRLVRAVRSRDAPAARPPPTGRPGQAKGGLFTFLGSAGAEANPSPQPELKKGKAAKGLGKAAAKPAAKPAAKAPAAKASASKAASASVKTIRKTKCAETPVAAAGRKRKESEVAGEDGVPDDDSEADDAFGEDADDAGGDEANSVRAATNPLAALLGADYASSENEEGEDGSQVPDGAKVPAKRQRVSIRNLTDEEQAEYRSKKYKERQASKQTHFQAIRPRDL